MLVLFPAHKYRENITVDESFDVSAILKKSIPENFSIENRIIKTTISLTEDELRNLILSELNKNENIDGLEISIENNQIGIYVKQKAWKYFPSELTFLLTSEIKDDKVKLILNDAKFGKINLNKEKVLKGVKANKIKFFNVVPLDGEIILEDEELKDLFIVDALRLSDHKASVDVKLELNSIQDLRKLMNILSKIK
ncbi:MAG: hypothetical protein N2B06_10830 [Clostridium sp.]